MKFNKKIAVAVSGAVLMMAGQFVLADSTTDIVDALVSKGVLTEEEGKLITKGHVSKQEKTPVIKEKDGAFSLSSPNGKNSIQLSGRLHFDYKNNDINNFGTTDPNLGGINYDRDSASTADHFGIRRARLGIKGRLGGMADYEATWNLVGSAVLDQIYLDVNKYEPLGVKFGKFKQPYNLEKLTSSNNIDFNERSYITQNGLNERLGVMLHGEPSGTGLTYAGSMFVMNDDATSVKDSDMSYAGRATMNFAEAMGNKDMIAHFGLAGYTADYQVAPTLSGNTDKALDATETRATIFSFRSASAGLNNAYRAQIAGTQVMGGYSYGDASPTTSKVHNTAGALEGILAYNNFKVQGEYSSAFYDAKSAGKLTDPSDQIKADVETGYLEAMYMLTGEKYADAYKKGAFGTIKPKSEFDFEKGSGLGAWEIGVRYDFFDVTGTEHNGTGKSRFQGGVAGGTGTNYADGNTCKYVASQPSCNGNGGGNTTTLGIKWILNPNIMVKANWAHTKFDNAFKPIDMSQGNSQKFIDSEDLLMIRGQYAF